VTLLTPLATIMTSRLRAKARVAVPSMRPVLTATSIWAVFALAKRSAGAPCPIWAASAFEPAKLKTTFTPPLAAEKFLPISLKASVSEAAARTVKSPVAAAAVGAGGSAVETGAAVVG